MTNDLTVKKEEAMMEAVVVGGDLSKLTPQQRIAYYKMRCDVVGVDWRTQPFGYVLFPQGGLKLFPLKELTEQQRARHKVSITSIDRIDVPGCIAFRAKAEMPDPEVPGTRQDTGIGVVSIEGLKGKDLANAIMKAETKAKKRATLSLLGLGTSEEEIADVKGARIVSVDEAHSEVASTENKPNLEAPTASNEIVEDPNSIISASSDWGIYAIATKCSFQGMTLEYLYNDPSKRKLVEKVWNTPELKQSLDVADQEALAGFGKFTK